MENGCLQKSERKNLKRHFWFVNFCFFRKKTVINYIFVFDLSIIKEWISVPWKRSFHYLVFKVCILSIFPFHPLTSFPFHPLQVSPFTPCKFPLSPPYKFPLFFECCLLILFLHELFPEIMRDREKQFQFRYFLEFARTTELCIKEFNSKQRCIRNTPSPSPFRYFRYVFYWIDR